MDKIGMRMQCKLRQLGGVPATFSFFKILNRFEQQFLEEGLTPEDLSFLEEGLTPEDLSFEKLSWRLFLL